MIDREDLDSNNVKWDIRIHLANKGKDSDGKWLVRKDASRKYIDRVLADQRVNDKALRGHMLLPVSKSMLARIFRLDPKTVGAKLAGVHPVTYDKGYPAYDLAEAAGYLTAPPDNQLEKVIASMKSDELPPRLRKEFWDGKNAQLKFQRQACELWHTEDVIDVFTEVFKTLRSGITLFTDNVNRQQELSKSQREMIVALSDDLLLSLSKSLTARSDLDSKVNFMLGDPDNEELSDG